MNTSVARLCPKFKHLSTTNTLRTRVCVAICYTNMGVAKFYTTLLEKLFPNNSIQTITSEALQKLDEQRKNINTRKGTRETKRKSKHKQNEKRKEDVLDERSVKKKGNYASGIRFEE